MTKKTGLASAVQKPLDPEDWVKEKSKSVPDQKTIHLVVDVPAELHRQFKGKCVMEGMKIKDAIQNLLEQYVAGKIKTI